MIVIDPEVAGALASAVPQADFVQILHAFEADLDRLAQDCARAAESGDPQALRRAAHSLAGTAAGIGAQRLEAAAREAMQAGDDPDPALIARIRTETAAVLVELASMAKPRPR
ncbi:Hpt domain-containing protein [Falsiroseomonas sp.]|uniref:Hpt domain-containing protein n=1 Tax=Falsiroseomonas sp. TaxID=2870721 RepID=UPI0035664872